MQSSNGRKNCKRTQFWAHVTGAHCGRFGGWQPVGKWTGSGWAKAQAALQKVTDDLAHCIGTEAEAW